MGEDILISFLPLITCFRGKPAEVCKRKPRDRGNPGLERLNTGSVGPRIPGGASDHAHGS